MSDRICPAADCGEVIPWRRGNPAKLCPTHLNASSCRVCGVEIRRAPGVTRGVLPKYCGPEHRYEAIKARRTPEQWEEHRRKNRESCRFDMFCLDCKKPIPRRDDGIRRDIRCQECKADWYVLRKRRDVRNKKFRQYGLTADQYDAKLAEQGGCCAFCKSQRAHPTLDHDFYVDHDHSCCPGKGLSCGKCVRFLLCHQCNIGVGNFRDDPAILRAAADALEIYHLERSLRGQANTPTEKESSHV